MDQNNDNHGPSSDFSITIPDFDLSDERSDIEDEDSDVKDERVYGGVSSPDIHDFLPDIYQVIQFREERIEFAREEVRQMLCVLTLKMADKENIENPVLVGNMTHLFDDLDRLLDHRCFCSQAELLADSTVIELEIAVAELRQYFVSVMSDLGGTD